MRGSEPGFARASPDPVNFKPLVQALDMKIVAAKKAALDRDDVAIRRRSETCIIGVAIDLAPPLAVIELDGEIAALGK